MDMKQLTTFVTLSRTLNYQKAAEQLQYAPSTLFKHIQLLEQEVGAPLVRKEGRGLVLTEAGAQFYEHARRILDEYHDALMNIGGRERRETAVSVGGCEINVAYDLMELFEEFNSTRTDVRMHMTFTPNSGVPALTRGEMVDIGFFYSLTRREHAGMQMLPLYQESAYLMAARDDGLAERQGLRYEDLAGVDFVYPHDSCCFVEKFMDCLSARGVSLGRGLYLGNMQLVIERARRGGVITLVPQGAVSHMQKNGLVCLSMREPPIRAWQCVLFKQYEALRPVARELLEHAVAHARAIAGRDGIRISEQAAGSLPFFE